MFKNWTSSFEKIKLLCIICCKSPRRGPNYRKVDVSKKNNLLLCSFFAELQTLLDTVIGEGIDFDEIIFNLLNELKIYDVRLSVEKTVALNN